MSKGLRTTPRINGIEYGWSSVELVVAGVPVFGATAINYGENQEMDNLYGLSTMPVAQGFGNFIMEGSITFHAGEIEALMTAARIKGYTKLQDLPEFDILVVYKPDDLDKFVTHRIKDVSFKNNTRDFSAGDMAIEVTIEMLFSGIDWSI